MKSSGEIVERGRFRPNQLIKAQVMEGQKALQEGNLGMTAAEKEQVASDSASAAADQAAQTQAAVSRSTLGQPAFAGQAAQFSADVAKSAQDQAAAGRSAANQMSQNLAASRTAYIQQQLNAAGQRRHDTGMAIANMGVSVVNSALMGGAVGAKKNKETAQDAAVVSGGV